MVTRWGMGVLLRFSHAPCPKGTGYQRAKIFGTLYMSARYMRNNNQILHGDQTIFEENFHRVDNATCPG